MGSLEEENENGGFTYVLLLAFFRVPNNLVDNSDRFGPEYAPVGDRDDYSFWGGWTAVWTPRSAAESRRPGPGAGGSAPAGYSKEKKGAHPRNYKRKGRFRGLVFVQDNWLR